MIRLQPISTLFPYTTLFRSKISQNLHTEMLLRAAVRKSGVWNTPEDLVNSAASFYTEAGIDRKSTRLNSSHRTISYAVFCLKKKIEQYAGGRAPRTGE